MNQYEGDLGNKLRNFLFISDYHSLDTRRIRLEPRSHRLGTRQPLPTTTNDQSSFLSSKANVNGDFLQDPQPLHTATLDRVTHRGNSRKSGHQTGGKYNQTNGIENRRYHTIGKMSMTPRSRPEIPECMNGSAVASSYLHLADSTSKKSNYYATTDSFFYRTNGNTSGRIRDEMPKRPKSTERLLDDVERSECCDFRPRDRPTRRRAERSSKSSRNGVTQNYNEEKQRREKKNADAVQEPIYEVIALKPESKKESRERRKDKHNRRPHSAPVLDTDHPIEESNHKSDRKCSHKNRKLAPPPPAYQDPAVAPLPKYRHPSSTPATSVLEVENNNKIILKVT